MISLRKSGDRGVSSHGWLESRHSFSFADYWDPNHVHFRALRVLNDDRVTPKAGFGEHGHRDMEIISYVLSGQLAHKDSMGNGSVIVPGDVQRMSAGTGVRHSEFNASESESLHFLQIWVVPERMGLPPSYEQKSFSEDERNGRLRLLASRNGTEGSLTLHQDVRMFGSLLQAGQSVKQPIADGRHAYLHVAKGSVSLGKHTLLEGDAALVSEEAELSLSGVASDAATAEILLFDLA